MTSANKQQAHRKHVTFKSTTSKHDKHGRLDTFDKVYSIVELLQEQYLYRLIASKTQEICRNHVEHLLAIGCDVCGRWTALASN